jgi:hypothetical protein
MFPGIKPDRNESLPEWITKAYNKRNPTYDSITQDLGAKPVTNIAEVDVDGFYLAKMPWYLRDYREVISEMIETAKKDPAIIAKINQNNDEYTRRNDDIREKYTIRYEQCLFEDEFSRAKEIQENLHKAQPRSKEYANLQGILNNLYSDYNHNRDKCKNIFANIRRELDEMNASVPRGITKVEELFRYDDLSEKPLLFIKVLGIHDGLIRCHGYDVKTGQIYSHLEELGNGRGVQVEMDVFSIHFRDVELFSFDEKKKGGKRRSKTNGRFRKYRSRRNVSSRTQSRKKTQRRQQQRQQQRQRR